MLLAFAAAELPPGLLEQRTERTITSRAALELDLREVRRRGYAVTDEELEPGLVAVAAPVFRDAATVVAALSMSALATRLTRSRIPAVAAQSSPRPRAVRGAGYQPQRSPRQRSKEGAA